MMKINMTQEIINNHYLFGTGQEKYKSQRKSCQQKLKDEIDGIIDSDILKLLLLLNRNLKKILIGTPGELFKVISLINKQKFFVLHNNNDKWLEFLEICNRIFVKDYEEFVERKVGVNSLWSAYKYVELLNVTICPYCNSQFIFYLNTDNGRTRPVLDHYFDKAKYPFLAISIHNLIPCCKICNSDFKGSKTMSYLHFLHPFEVSFGEEVFFEKRIYQEDNIDYHAAILGENHQYKIIINVNKAKRALKEKVNNNNQMFHIEDLYNSYHKRYVNDLVIKTRIYNDLYLTQLSETFNKLFGNNIGLREHLIPNDNDVNLVLLSKLTTDIVLRELE